MQITKIQSQENQAHYSLVLQSSNSHGKNIEQEVTPESNPAWQPAKSRTHQSPDSPRNLETQQNQNCKVVLRSKFIVLEPEENHEECNTEENSEGKEVEDGSSSVNTMQETEEEVSQNEPEPGTQPNEAYFKRLKGTQDLQKKKNQGHSQI